MHYNSVADSFHMKKLCSRLYSSKVRFYTESGRFTFWAPLWGLGATYDSHLWLIGKRIVDFLLALTELFSLSVTAEELRANIFLTFCHDAHVWRRDGWTDSFLL